MERAIGKFDRDEFAKFACRHAIGVSEEPFTLKSGRKSYWYVNWRKATDRYWLLVELAKHVVSYCKQVYRADMPLCFYGVPEGATKLALITQLLWVECVNPESQRMAMGRGKPKEHGDPRDRFFIGAPTGNVIILEDVTTTGDSLFGACESVEALKEGDPSTNIVGLLGLTDRKNVRDDGLTVEQCAEKLGYRYLSLSNAHNLLQLYGSKARLSDTVVRGINEEFGAEMIVPTTRI